MHGKLKRWRDVRRLLSLKSFPLTIEIVDMLYMFCINNLHNTIYDSHIKQSENRDTYVMINI
jgi:ribose 5-phosphate isomerase